MLEQEKKKQEEALKRRRDKENLELEAKNQCMILFFLFLVQDYLFS